MKARMLPLALLAVRGWTRVYTWGMPAPIGEARRAEIQSDLWEFLHDVDRDQRFSAAQLFGRVLLGVSDDLCWRLEHDLTRHEFLKRRIVALTAAALVPITLWIVAVRLRQTEPSARTRVSECAEDSRPAHTTPELRMRVITCAGVFFTPPRHADVPPDRP
jgi:hypothetical protein